MSYVLLRGRCAKCNAHVSARYPLTELGTALLAALSLFAFGPTLMALAAFGLCATLLATSLIDFDTRYLPDTLTLPLLWAGLIVNLGDTAFVPLHEAVIGAIAGYLFLWCVYWLFRLVRGVEGMGYGDFKLLAALGAWLGWQALPQVVLLSAVAGAIFGLAATGIGFLATRTRCAAAFTMARKAASPDALASIPAAICSAGTRLCEVTRSPPAVRKPMARFASGTDWTAVAWPRSSDTMTPLKPRPPRSSRITVGEKTASSAGSILV